MSKLSNAVGNMVNLPSGAFDLGKLLHGYIKLSRHVSVIIRKIIQDWRNVWDISIYKNILNFSRYSNQGLLLEVEPHDIIKHTPSHRNFDKKISNTSVEFYVNW